jgi:hypothetical protein
MKLSRPRFTIIVTGLGFFAVCVSLVEATPYDNLIDTGNAKLQEALDNSASIQTREQLRAVIEQYQQAAGIFLEAERQEPTKGAAWLWRGATFNRIGEVIEQFNSKTTDKNEPGAGEAFCTALSEIRHAQTLMTATDDPSLLVALAFSLVNTGQTLEAKGAIDEFFSLGIGDAALRAGAGTIRVKIGAAIKATQAAKEKIHICGSAPKPFVVAPKPVANQSPEMVGKTGQPAPESTVQSQYLKSLTTGFGYNGNVIPLGNGLPLPRGFSHKDAAYEESTLNLEGDWFFHHPGDPEWQIDELAATYIGVHDAYIDAAPANSLVQTGGLAYCHCLSEQACLGFAIKDAWVRSDTKNLSNILTLQPSASYAESPELTTKLSYSAIRFDFPITPKHAFAVQDGFGHQVSIQQTWAHQISDGIWSPSATLTASYFHQWFVTDGIIGDKQRNDPLVKADWCIFKANSICTKVRSVNLAASYEYRHDGFENATFPTLTSANRFKRQDDAHLFDVKLTCKLLYDEKLKNRLEAVAEYQSNINNSNVATKEYNQPLFIASLKVNF